MPEITDPIPGGLQAEMDDLRRGLDDALPAKVLDRNLIIGSWNIRAFGDFQRRWTGDPDESPKRDMFSLRCIAEVLQRFDVVAIQEIRDNLASLRHVVKYLRSEGDHWGLLLTDVTKGSAGNHERLGFLFDTRKVTLSGLACELVLPPEGGDPANQFARTPYAVAFECGGQTFILVTLHVLYGSSASEREPELRAIAQWLHDWAKDEHAWHHNLIVMGDFNIDRVGDPRYQAFTETGLRTHPDHAALPATIFHDPEKPDDYAHYDQMAWFAGQGVAPLSLGVGRGGHFDFRNYVMKAETRNDVSWKLSDHYPLWVEFFTRSAAVASVTAAPQLQVTIPEVLFEAPAGAHSSAEWVEVANRGPAAVDLSGWTLSDEASNTFAFPAGFTLGPNESVRIHTGDGVDGRNQLHWGRGAGVWNDSGDTAILKDANGRVVASNGG